MNDVHAIANEALAAAEAEPAPPDAEPPEPERVLLHMPVDVRSASLAVLAVLASLFVLHWAKEVFIPILLGVMFSYALEPIVARLERWRVPRALGSALLILAILGGARLDRPRAFRRCDGVDRVAARCGAEAAPVDEPLGRAGRARSTRCRRPRREIERAAEENAAASAVNKRGVTSVQVEKPRFDVRDWLWPGALGLRRPSARRWRSASSPTSCSPRAAPSGARW